MTGPQGRAVGLLSIGIGASGVLTYAYFALASHELPPDRYGALVVLWSVLFVVIVTLYRPVEQFVSRAVAHREEVGEPLTGALRTAAVIQLGLATAFVALALLLRTPIEDELLSGEGTLYAVLVLAAPAYAVSFFARGYLAGRARFGLYGAMLLLESTSRFTVAVLVAVGVATGVSAISLGILVAPICSLVVVPSVILRRLRPGESSTRPMREHEVLGSATALTPDVSLGGGTRFILAAFLIMLAEQTLLNAGVLIVRADEGAAAAGLIFNILLLARAPQVLFGAVTTSLLPSLSRLRARGREVGERAFESTVRMTIALIAGFTALVAGVVLVAGPELMELTFGDDLTYERVGLLIVVAGMGCHLASLTLTQSALARGQASAAAACWILCAAAFVALSLAGPAAGVRRIELGYALAMLLLVPMLGRIYRAGAGPRAGTVVR